MKTYTKKETKPPATPGWYPTGLCQCLRWWPRESYIGDQTGGSRRTSTHKAYEKCKTCEGHGIMPIPMKDLK